MSSTKTDNTQQLLSTTQKLGKSSEETTQTVQKIKTINAALVDITQKQYDVVNQVSSDGEQIKTQLSISVNQANDALSVLNKTVNTMEMEFSHMEKSINLFDKIQESTESLNNVARHTRMLALNTSVLGGSLGKDGNGIRVVAEEMQSLVKTCEEASQRIELVVSSVRQNIQDIVNLNKEHIQESLKNTDRVKLSLKTLILLVTGSEETASKTNESSVATILSSVGSIEQLAQQVRKIAEETQIETEVLNNEVEVSNQAVSDLIGVVTNTPITNLSPHQAYETITSYRIIDVRRDDEFNDQLGHIAKARLCTINESTFNAKLQLLNQDKQYLFVCRSGGRSSRAARIAQGLGFHHIFNLEGGMLAWDKCQLPVERV